MQEQSDSRQSTAGKRVGKQRIRKLMDFEYNPPRCMNCSHFRPPSYGAPESKNNKKRPYLPRRCGIGGFEVNAWSICNEWQGKEGEVLKDG